MEHLLNVRQQFKDAYRAKLRKEFTDNYVQKNKVPVTEDNNYGNFFGPSETVFSERLIQETKLMIETKATTTSNGGGKSIRGAIEKIQNEQLETSIETSCNGMKGKSDSMEKKEKVEKIRDSRDYSFLLTDDVSIPEKKSDIDLNAFDVKKKPPSQPINVNEIAKTIHPGNLVEKKPSSQPVEVVNKIVKNIHSESEENLRFPDKIVKKVPSTISVQRSNLAKDKPIRPIVNSLETKKPAFEQKRKLEDSKEPQRKVLKRREVREETEDDVAIEMIRRMFRYDPTKYGNDKDDIVEANFADIEKEERRSAKMAKKEDDLELRKLETKNNMKPKLMKR